MFFGVLSLIYHSPITNGSRSYRTNVDASLRVRERLSRSPPCALFPPAVGVQQSRHTVSNVVSNLSYLAERLSLRIGQRPVVVLQTRHERAGIPAAHRDEQRCVARKVIGQSLWSFRAQIDTDF